MSPGLQLDVLTRHRTPSLHLSRGVCPAHLGVAKIPEQFTPPPPPPTLHQQRVLLTVPLPLLLLHTRSSPLYNLTISIREEREKVEEEEEAGRPGGACN